MIEPIKKSRINVSTDCKEQGMCFHGGIMTADGGIMTVQTQLRKRVRKFFYDTLICTSLYLNKCSSLDRKPWKKTLKNSNKDAEV